MQIGKPIITISAVAVLLFAGFFLVQYLVLPAHNMLPQAVSRDNPEMLDIAGARTEESNRQDSGTPSLVRPVASNAPSPVTERVDELEQEIATLSDADISTHAERIKSEIYHADLIDRLNRDQVTKKERENANDSFLRLALLGIEKAKRGLKELEPALERSLKKHQEDMAEIRAMLEEKN